MYVEFQNQLKAQLDEPRVTDYMGLLRYVQHAHRYISPARSNREQVLDVIRQLGSNYVWCARADLEEGLLISPEYYIKEAFWITHDGLCVNASTKAREKTLYFMLRRILFTAHHKGYIANPDYIYKDYSNIVSPRREFKPMTFRNLLKLRRALKRTYADGGFTTGGLVLFLMLYSGRPIGDVKRFTWNSFTYTKQGYFKSVRYKGDRYYRTPRWFNDAFIKWAEAENIDLDSAYILQRRDGSGKPYRDTQPLINEAKEALKECGVEDKYTFCYISILLRKTRSKYKRQGTGLVSRIDTFTWYTRSYLDMLAKHGRFYKLMSRR